VLAVAKPWSQSHSVCLHMLAGVRLSRGSLCSFLSAILLLGSAALPPHGAIPALDGLLRTGIASSRAGAPVYALQAFTLVANSAPSSALAVLWAGVAAVAAGRTRDARMWFRVTLDRPHSIEEAHVAEAWLDRLTAVAVPVHPGASTWLLVAGLPRASNPHLTDAQAR